MKQENRTRLSRVPYSPTEEKLLKILNSRKRSSISSIELCEQFYQKDDRPFHAQQAINVAMRSLIKKVEYNREEFRIERTERRGPYPIEFRLVTKTKIKAALASV